MTATLLRRMDHVASSGRLRTECEAEFWSYVWTVAENIARESEKRSERERGAWEGCVDWAAGGADVVDSEGAIAEAARVEHAAGGNRLDAELLQMRARESCGFTAANRGGMYAVLSLMTGCTETALRRRWATLRARLNGSK